MASKLSYNIGIAPAKEKKKEMLQLTSDREYLDSKPS